MTDEVKHETHHEAEGDSSKEPWRVQALFAFGGLVLLAGAVVAWQFKDSLGGSIGQALPWLIAAAVVLGAGALVESISTTVWVTLIGGLFLLGITFVITGRVATYPSDSQTIFVVDRFTGDAELCNARFCQVLPRYGGNFLQPLPKVKLPIKK